jgi:plastocyanin
MRASKVIWLWALVVVVAGASISAGAWAAAKHTISQKDKAFSAAQIEVKVGDSIEFQNDDDVSHNVFSVSKSDPFNTKVQKPGSSAAVTFANEGLIEVRCAIHPNMKLLVTVVK